MCLGKNCTNVQRFFKTYNLEDVHCSCGYRYCIRCNSKGHHPCNCVISKNWIEKENSERENIQWIIAKTKKCPRCRIPIEKNQGCNHMICYSCSFEFCWLCKSNWKNHGCSTGGFYRCNIFESKKKRFKESKDQEVARSELERYSFYFKRYKNHMKSIPQIELFLAKDSFSRNLIDTVKECRHLLAWTYPIAYYMEENYALKNLFQQYQRDLERYTEHLHGLLEKMKNDAVINYQQNQVLKYWKTIERYRISLTKMIEREINVTCSFSKY